MCNRTVVRLRTESFKRGNSFVVAKTLTPLKKRSSGYSLLEEEIQYDTEELQLIVNLNDVVDGIYELDYNNPTGVGTYDFDHNGYKLIPYN